jgi:DNA-binding NarL/FixJ family response regulator
MRQNVGIRERLIVALREGGLEKVTPAEALVATHLIAGKDEQGDRHLRRAEREHGEAPLAEHAQPPRLRHAGERGRARDPARVALGHTVKKTAAILGIGKKTVETHLCALRVKFGAHNMVQLVNATRKAARG